MSQQNQKDCHTAKAIQAGSVTKMKTLRSCHIGVDEAISTSRASHAEPKNTNREAELDAPF
jgi:hypothetical protein